MALTTLTYPGPHPVWWQWPLMIGIPRQIEGLRNDLLRGSGTEEFAKIEIISEDRHYNIVFFDANIPFDHYQPLENCSADLIFIFSPFEDISGIISGEGDELLEFYRANGILTFTARDLPEFFSKFVEALSHNKNVPDALFDAGVNGTFKYDPKLETESTVSQAGEKIFQGSKPGTITHLDHRFRREHTTAAMPPPETAPPGVANGGGGVKKNGGGGVKKKAKKKARGRSAAKPAKATHSPKPPGTPRYLQAAVQAAEEITIKASLKPNTEYKLKVRIGYEDEAFTDSGHEFDTDTVFDESKKKEEKIHLQFKSNFNDKMQSGMINLPREGESDTETFAFKTDKRSKKLEAELFAYHKNRLIQHVQITKPVSKTGKKKGGKMLMKLVFCTKRDLSGLADRKEYAASVTYEAGKKKKSSIHGISKNKAVDLYFSDGLKVHLDDMKLAIEEALLDVTKHPTKLDAPANVALLSFLASKGALIRINHIRDAIAPDGPLQIISNRQEYVPLDFVYSLNPPDDNATLCKNAAAALASGKCMKCFDHDLDPAPHICPFGFWSFSRIVERHSFLRRKNDKNSDYQVVSEPEKNRDPLSVLENSIYGSSARVETEQTKGIRKEIETELKKNSKVLYNADDWKTWTKLVEQHKPESIFLVVHVEKDKIKKMDTIELGKKDFLPQLYFGSKLLVKKKMTSPPFIVIIGCETSNIKIAGFDISSHFINEGAAIVVSNFTKVRGRQAKDIVIKLSEFIHQNGKKEILFGEIMLKLRQYLLSQGMIAGLSLVAHGDADWKIKT